MNDCQWQSEPWRDRAAARQWGPSQTVDEVFGKQRLYFVKPIVFSGRRRRRPLRICVPIVCLQKPFVFFGRSKPLPYRVCASIVRPQKPFVTLTPSTTPWSPSLPEGGLDYTSPLSSETSHFLRRGRRPRRPVSTSFSQTASLSVILSVVEVL